MFGAAIFSLFYQVLIRPLQVPEPARLVNLAPSPIDRFSYPMFRDLDDAEALMGTIPRSSLSIRQRDTTTSARVDNLRTMKMQVQDYVYIDRLVTVHSTAFAVLVTVLAAIGLYGVLTYSVRQRSRELGLRSALGAEPSRLRALILKQVGMMSAIGSAVGAAVAIGLSRTVESMLFGVPGFEPVTLVGAVVPLSLRPEGCAPRQ